MVEKVLDVPERQLGREWKKVRGYGEHCVGIGDHREHWRKEKQVRQRALVCQGRGEQAVLPVV